MIIVAAATFPHKIAQGDPSWHLGAYQDTAVLEPVIIAKNGRPRTILLGYEEHGLSKRDRQVQLTSNLSPAEIDAVEASQMDAGHDHLDSELG